MPANQSAADMRLVLDANVLFPTVLREILLGLAEQKVFTPLWSDRILEEWARATRKLPKGAEPIARAEIALLKTQWPTATIGAQPQENALSLPDENDVHVLETAITGKADAIVTRNLGDFPTRTLARHDLLRYEPDAFLLSCLSDHPSALSSVLDRVVERAEAASGRPQPLVALLKRSKLPRLAKTFRSR